MLLRRCSLLSKIVGKSHKSASYCSLPTIRRTSHRSTDSKSAEKAFVVSYLIDSCGLSPENAVAASKKLHFDAPEHPDSVVNYLKKLGFEMSQIAELVRKRPHILVSDIEKTLSPKIDFYLNETVLSAGDVIKLASTHPMFLFRRLEHTVSPVYNYLKDVIGSEKCGALLKRGSWIFLYGLEKRLVPNVEFLRKLGLTEQALQFGLSFCPDLVCSKLEKLKELVDEVKEMGFDPSKVAFVVALNARTGANALLWDRSYAVYRRWGLSEDEIRMAYMKHPGCMLVSEKKISAVLDLLVNKMGREVRAVAKAPTAIMLNVEKRLLPRCSVIRLLRSEGLIKENWGCAHAFNISEEDFLKGFVERHAGKIPRLYEVYRLSKEKGILV